MTASLYLLRSAQHLQHHAAFLNATTLVSQPLVLMSDALFYADQFDPVQFKLYALEQDATAVGLVSDQVTVLTYMDLTKLMLQFDKIVSLP